jgi:hypothetical protein
VTSGHACIGQALRGCACTGETLLGLDGWVGVDVVVVVVLAPSEAASTLRADPALGTPDRVGRWCWRWVT